MRHRSEMGMAFLSQGVWAELTTAVKKSKLPSYVAVAYFSEGASRQLPLHSGSHLVVDASEYSVKAGRTNPSELLKMHHRGVRVYCEPKLHAKVFVVGKTAYVGSNNASRNSANNLIEASICTTDPDAVAAARKFVANHCLNELGPDALKQLEMIYEPPKFSGDRRERGSQKIKLGPTVSRLFLTQLVLGEWSEEEQQLHDRGEPIARKNCQHPRNWVLDSFPLYSRCSYSEGDRIVKVTDEGNGKILVDCPGHITRIEGPEKINNRLTYFAFIEHPNRRRRSVRAIAKAVGCTQKSMREDRRVSQSLARELLKVWG